MTSRFPPRERLTIHFAHVAYRLAERFALRESGIRHFQTWNVEDTLARCAQAQVLVLSGLWRDEMLERAGRLRFIQVCAAGHEHFPATRLAAAGVRLASGRGVNTNAVAEHAMALMLALARQLHTGRDHQRARHWRGMVPDLAAREEELAGKRLLIYGLGGIGARLARLASAFDMRVLGIRRDAGKRSEGVEEVHPPGALLRLLPEADFVALTCPLNEATRGVIDARALRAMQPGACLVNVARGACVDEGALVEALRGGRIAGAGVDVTTEEPLPPESALWDLENVVLTPHTAGETRRYEDNVVDLLLENLERLWRGEERLRNQVV